MSGIRFLTFQAAAKDATKTQLFTDRILQVYKSSDFVSAGNATVSALRQATSKGPSWPRFRCPSTHFLSPRPWGVHIMFKTFAVNAPSPHNFTTTTDHKLLSLSNNSVNLQFKLYNRKPPCSPSHWSPGPTLKVRESVRNFQYFK